MNKKITHLQETAENYSFREMAESFCKLLKTDRKMFFIYLRIFKMQYDKQLRSKGAEMSKDSDTQEQYDKHHKPCDNLSHDCHIEYDTLSHDRSCWNCEHFEYEEDDDGSEIMFCHHDDMRTSLQLPLKDCKLYEATNGKLSR